MKLFIISGRSGSGKTICLHVLEDLGFYCIDNLPIGLLVDMVQQMKHEQEFVAVSIDARNLTSQLMDIGKTLEPLKQMGIEVEVIFLDAETQTLMKRFSETKRKHPLSRQGLSLEEALTIEQELLSHLEVMADITINTSYLSMHELRDSLHSRFESQNNTFLSVCFTSFGFKSGLPFDADFVFDVRCLPNPYWEPGLSSFTGRDPSVIAFLENQPQTRLLLEDIQKFLERWIPSFEASNRSYLQIAIGCTGGQHRSVYIAEQLYHFFQSKRDNVLIKHRELS